jgi:predicted transcriptional regulator
MRVLLSIKPKFAAKIFDGSKGYEYRRTIFKRQEVTTVVVYASDPVRKVIGEFDIGGIIQEDPELLWSKTKDHAGITWEGFLEYFENRKKGYAIKIASTRHYDVPMSLSSLLLSSPPQSFRYLSD